MKFVDEAIIYVHAGRGGDGCLSFRREKYVPRGGPDGGDGGDGGCVYLKGSKALNTLVDFRHDRVHKAEHGEGGAGKERRGKSGDDLIIPVPVGTKVFDTETGECLGDIQADGEMLLVAQGGYHGLGNTRYKSSTNRAPRQTSKGTPGESRMLKLELQVLADVGLLGLPNAGKSTLLSAVSSARPKVADYPFTTLHPSLGVVTTDAHQSFVMADIPGLIEGAASGAGLGHRFLKHLSRTSILLHLVDIAPIDGEAPAKAVQTVLSELEKYNAELLEKPRWLVLNKIDCFPSEAEKSDSIQKLIEELNWTEPYFCISAHTGAGIDELKHAIMRVVHPQDEA